MADVLCLYYVNTFASNSLKWSFGDIISGGRGIEDKACRI